MCIGLIYMYNLCSYQINIVAFYFLDITMSYNRGRGFGFTGFSFAKKQETIPPPPNATLSKHGYHTMTAISQNAISGGCGYGQPRKRPRDEDE